MQVADIELAGDFLVMAATLMEIKSRMLLPQSGDASATTAEADDPRRELVKQLVEYKKFKDAAAQLQARALEQERTFARAGLKVADFATAPLPLGEVGIFQLINALQTVIKRVEAREDLQQLFGEHYTVSDKIDLILRQMASGVSLKFSELFAQMASRIEIVVTFLALLELIRLKQVRASQSSPFEEIEIAPVVLN